MKHPTITELSHLFMKQYLTNDMVAADCTAGNGNDTLFLAQLCKRVYSFDIQTQAIENTRQKTQTYDHVTVIQDSHANIKQYIHEPLDFAIFNFGYLPKGDHSITTMAQTSLVAVQDCLELLKESGFVCLCFYVGHLEGKKEMETIIQYLKTQPLLLSSYQTHVPQAPVLYLVSKKGNSL
ncbi:MAG: class I SAM-dependent methyltransferase [Erysipelotrichaceae bacterium]|nr:class I SAM-dependent methyltransferase [Erysipelotrichaceae bacterium]